MSKKAYRTESQEVPPATKPVHAWFFERANGHSYEHLAVIEKVNDDGTATISFKRMGERDREILTCVKPVGANNFESGWVRA